MAEDIVNAEEKHEESLEEQVARIRAHRKAGENWKPRARRILNTVFLVLGAAGVVQYYLAPDDRVNALIIIGIALGFKIVEILIRILG